MMSSVFGSVSVGPVAGLTMTKIADFRFVIVELKTKVVTIRVSVSSQSQIGNLQLEISTSSPRPW
jgi:hypothetical protein